LLTAWYTNMAAMTKITRKSRENHEIITTEKTTRKSRENHEIITRKQREDHEKITRKSREVYQLDSFEKLGKTWNRKEKQDKK
jgi:hypothetical protein